MRACEWCAEEFEPKQKSRRFCSRSCVARWNNSRRDFSGTNNPRFNGGLSEWDGRKIIVCRDYSWVFYYRAVMEAHLRRELRPEELVHHINGDPSDDRIENLQLVTRGEHINMHRAELVAARKAKGWRRDTTARRPKKVAA